MGTLALIGLGSNLGDRKAILDAAVASLSETPCVEVLSVSSYHETAAVGGPPGQGPFLNATAAVETTLDPVGLHARLQRIEEEAGRVRSVRWGERLLDLDLLLYGNLVREDDSGLTIPHPRMAVRRFVLAPLAEVAPGALEPRTGRPVVDLLENLDRRPNVLVLVGEPVLVRAVSGPLIDRLEARAILAGKDRPTECYDASILPPSESKCFEEWNAASTAMDPDRFADNSQSSKWIVSDCWPDLIYARAAQSSGQMDMPWLPRFREAFVEARSRLLRPTFVAALGAPGRALRRMVESACRGDRSIGGSPILNPGPFEAEANLAEILAACASCRPAGPEIAPRS